MELKEYLEIIKKFIKDYLDASHMDGYVLGLSGGIDSALVARLTMESVGKDKLFCLMLPCHSNEDDLNDAVQFAKKFDIRYEVVDLSKAFDEIYKSITAKHPLEGLSEHNIKVRLRMVTLYAIAQQRKSLVLGTDNWDENYVGYFTKYGDGACDLLPIVCLTKGEVFQASRMLGVTKNILNKKPTAGLYANQTDEGEMGVTYQELDDYLLGKPISREAQNKILHMHNVSEHKRKNIPTPANFSR